MGNQDETRALFRDLLGMTNGGTAGGREPMSLPDDIMDALGGDIAQDNLAREKLLQEMRRADDRKHDPRFVSLDLMEMEADHVDEFLKKARKKIIKRSKDTRKGCCSRIGGVLNQMMGGAGGDYAKEVKADDRGREDPIGDADGAGKSVSEDLTAELLDFITEEFFDFEHDQDCPLADPRRNTPSGPLGEAERYLNAPKKPGLLRDAYGLREGEALPLDRVDEDYERLHSELVSEGSLPGDKMRLYKRLRVVKKVLKPKKDNDDQQEEMVMMEPSQTANALSSFMEASSAVNRYKAAEGGSGKGSPDAGQMKTSGPAGDLELKTREGDDDHYPTDLMPVKGKVNKTSGEPQSLSTRGVKRGDPIGEASGTAVALSHFMEATSQKQVRQQKMGMKDTVAGDLDLSKRSQQPYGLPPVKATKARSGLKAADADEKKPRYEKDADPRGEAIPAEQGAGKLKNR